MHPEPSSLGFYLGGADREFLSGVEYDLVADRFSVFAEEAPTSDETEDACPLTFRGKLRPKTVHQNPIRGHADPLTCPEAQLILRQLGDETE